MNEETKKSILAAFKKILTFIKYFGLVFYSLLLLFMSADLYTVITDPELYPWRVSGLPFNYDSPRMYIITSLCQLFVFLCYIVSFILHRKSKKKIFNYVMFAIILLQIFKIIINKILYNF